MLKRILIALPLLLASVLWAQTASPPVPSSAAPPLIILIGPPLSGKTTLADSITRTYSVPNISVEDLIKDHAAELEHLRGQGMSMAEMRYDPAMSRYLRERLKTADLSHGLALDGYPATLVQAEDLSKMVPGLNLKPIAFQLQVPTTSFASAPKRPDERATARRFWSSASRTTIARWTPFRSTSPKPTSWPWMPTNPKPRCGRRSRPGWRRRDQAAAKVVSIHEGVPSLFRVLCEKGWCLRHVNEAHSF